MYTCDLCARDQGSTENLLRVNFSDGMGDQFYGTCDLLVCSNCYDENSDSLELVEGEND